MSHVCFSVSAIDGCFFLLVSDLDRFQDDTHKRMNEWKGKITSQEEITKRNDSYTFLRRTRSHLTFGWVEIRGDRITCCQSHRCVPPCEFWLYPIISWSFKQMKTINFRSNRKKGAKNTDRMVNERVNTCLSHIDAVESASKPVWPFSKNTAFIDLHRWKWLVQIHD